MRKSIFIHFLAATLIICATANCTPDNPENNPNEEQTENNNGQEENTEPQSEEYGIFVVNTPLSKQSSWVPFYAGIKNDSSKFGVNGLPTGTFTSIIVTEKGKCSNNAEILSQIKADLDILEEAYQEYKALYTLKQFLEALLCSGGDTYIDFHPMKDGEYDVVAYEISLDGVVSGKYGISTITIGEPGGNEGGDNNDTPAGGRQVAKITWTTPDDPFTYEAMEFAYNNSGSITHIKYSHSSGRSKVVAITSKDDAVVLPYYSYSSYKDMFELEFNINALFSNEYVKYGILIIEDHLWDIYKYNQDNDGYLTSVENYDRRIDKALTHNNLESIMANANNENVGVSNYLWENGDLTKIDYTREADNIKTTTTFDYGQNLIHKTSVNLFELILEGIHTRFRYTSYKIGAFFPITKESQHYPIKKTVNDSYEYTYEYTFDSKGYPTKIITNYESEVSEMTIEYK